MTAVMEEVRLACIGCGKLLPEGREWFCRTACIEKWQTAYETQEDEVAE